MFYCINACDYLKEIIKTVCRTKRRLDDLKFIVQTETIVFWVVNQIFLSRPYFGFSVDGSPEYSQR